jgi:hypothetical protein
MSSAKLLGDRRDLRLRPDQDGLDEARLRRIRHRLERVLVARVGDGRRDGHVSARRFDQAAVLRVQRVGDQGGLVHGDVFRRWGLGTDARQGRSTDEVSVP